MATFAQLGLIAQETEFQQRVQYAMSVTAATVYGENPATAGHAVRASYANKVLNGQFSLVGACYGVLSFNAIANEATLPASGSLIANGTTSSGNATLLFQAVASWVVSGMLVTGVTNPDAILPNSKVQSVTATSVLLNQNVVGSGVLPSDTIAFQGFPNDNGIPDNHIQQAINAIWNALAWA